MVYKEEHHASQTYRRYRSTEVTIIRLVLVYSINTVPEYSEGLFLRECSLDVVFSPCWCAFTAALSLQLSLYWSTARIFQIFASRCTRVQAVHCTGVQRLLFLFAFLKAQAFWQLPWDFDLFVVWCTVPLPAITDCKFGRSFFIPIAWL